MLLLTGKQIRRRKKKRLTKTDGQWKPNIIHTTQSLSFVIRGHAYLFVKVLASLRVSVLMFETKQHDASNRHQVINH